MGCHPDEAAFVLGLISHRFNKETVMRMLGLNAWAFDHYQAKNPVRIALDRWRKYGRLPKPRSLKSVHERSKKRKDSTVRRSQEKGGSPAGLLGGFRRASS